MSVVPTNEISPRVIFAEVQNFAFSPSELHLTCFRHSILGLEDLDKITVDNSIGSLAMAEGLWHLWTTVASHLMLGPIGINCGTWKMAWIHRPRLGVRNPSTEKMGLAGLWDKTRVPLLGDPPFLFWGWCLLWLAAYSWPPWCLHNFVSGASRLNDCWKEVQMNKVVLLGGQTSSILAAKIFLHWTETRVVPTFRCTGVQLSVLCTT